MRSSTKRILSILFAGILFIVALAVYANLIQPELEKLNETRKNVFSKDKKFQEEKAAVEKVQELLKKLRGATELHGTVEMVLPGRSNITQIIAQVQAIAGSSQTEINSFAIKEQPLRSSATSLVRRLGVLGVDLDLSGSYESIKSFLSALETNVRLFNVKQFSLGPVGGNAENSLPTDFFNLKVGMEAYYQE